MNKLLLFTLIGLGFLILFIPPVNSYIPPTRAFEQFFVGSSHVQASNYMGNFSFIAGSNINLVLANGTKPSLTISSTGGNSGIGTYNETFANNALINSGGYFLNFINGTNNPIHIVNSNGGNKINITISDTTGGGSGSPTLDTIQCIGIHGECLYFGNNTNTNFEFKNILGGQGVGITGNNSNVIISTNFKANSKTCSAGQFISAIDNSTGTVTCNTPSSSGSPVVLDSNLTSSSTSAFTHIWNIPLTANSGNVVTGTLVATTNTDGGAVQVGANMSSTHGQGLCTFFYGSAATTGIFFSAALGTTSSDSAWTTWLAGANIAAPVHFECAIVTDSSPPNLQLNFQAEVSSTVSIKAGSYYIHTP